MAWIELVDVFEWEWVARKQRRMAWGPGQRWKAHDPREIRG